MATRTSWLIALLAIFLAPPAALAAQKASPRTEAISGKTLFINCKDEKKPLRVLSPDSLSETGDWRAYVEVDIQPGCLHTTHLWVGNRTGEFRLLYLMPPKRDAAGNGMQILGWARHSRMLLVRTEQWQYGSDADDVEQVLAIDADTGMLYEPNLSSLLQDRKDAQCMFRVVDAGFTATRNVEILVRAKVSTEINPDQELEEIPASKRCADAVETWSFNFATGETRKVNDVESFQLFRKFVPHRRQN